MNNIIKEDLDLIEKECSSLKEFFENRKILITGATGFMGKWLLLALNHLNQKNNWNIEVTINTRNFKKFSEQCPELATFCKHITCDIREIDQHEYLGDYIIHAGVSANIADHHANALESYETIVEGTKSLLKLALKGNIKKILNISSGAIYGRQPGAVEFLSEDFQGAPDPLDIRNSYGESKRVAELLCNIYGQKYSFDVVHARCFAFTGPYLPLDASFAVGNFIGDLLKGRQIHLTGDGSPLRSYMYAADLVIWLLHLLVKGENLQAYNVGGEEVVSIKELALGLDALHQGRSYSFLVQSDMTASKYLPNVTKAKKELGFKFYTGLERGLKRTLEWNG